MKALVYTHVVVDKTNCQGDYMSRLMHTTNMCWNSFYNLPRNLADRVFIVVKIVILRNHQLEAGSVVLKCAVCMDTLHINSWSTNQSIVALS